MNPPCQRCGKLVYPMEKLKCLDLYWHKPCFKCEVCGTTLNLKNYKGYNKKPYCQAHYPQTKFTTVAETPEMQRLKQLTEQQSQAMYHKQFEEEKGRFTAVAEDPELLRLKKNTQLNSAVKYHAEFERQKGTKLSVDTDPEIERTKRNMATISNAEYHNLKQQRNDQEKRRPSDAEQYSQMPYLLQDTTYDKARHYSIDAGQPSYVGSLPRQKGGENTAKSLYAGGSQTLPRKVGEYAHEERRGSNNSDDQFKHVHSTSGSASKPIGSIFDKDDPLQEDEFYKERMRDKQRRASYQRKEKQLHGFGYVAQPAPVKQASLDSAGSQSSYQDQAAQNRPQSTGAYDYQYGNTGSGYDHHQPGHERHSAYNQYRHSEYEPQQHSGHDHHRQEEPKKRNIYQPTPFSMTDARVVKSVPQDKAQSSPQAQRRPNDDGQNQGYTVERQYRGEAPKQMEPKVQNMDRQNQDPRRYEEPQGYRNDEQRYQEELQKSYVDESRKGYPTDMQRGFQPDVRGDQKPAYQEEPARGYNEPPRGFSDPQQGYHDRPQKGHNDPQKGYMETSIGYNDPPMGYNEPPKGYNEPPKGYNEPPKGYNEPPKGYNEPPKGYSEPPKGYNEPQRGSYIEPQKGYTEPQKGYSVPQQGSYSEPNRGSYGEQPKNHSDPRSYTEPPKSYKEPQRGYSEDVQSYPAEPKGYPPQHEEPARGGYPEPARDEPPKSQQQKPNDFQYGAPQKGYESPRLNNARLGYNDPQKGFVSSEDLKMPDLYPQIHNNIHDPPKSYSDAPQDNPRGYNGQREDPHTPQKEDRKAKNGVPGYMQEQNFQSPYSARSQPKIAYSSVADEPAPQTHKIGSVADLDPHPARNDYRHSSGNQYGGQPQYQPPAQTQHAPQPHHAPVQQQMSGRGTHQTHHSHQTHPTHLSHHHQAAHQTQQAHHQTSHQAHQTSHQTHQTSHPIHQMSHQTQQSSHHQTQHPAHESHHSHQTHESPSRFSTFKQQHSVPTTPRYQALYDYSAGDDDEVTFQEGDIIVDTETIDPGWMMGRVERTGKSGMLPSNYVEELR
ncbi:LIM and SH3 domain protein Lasp-like isoform X4 [Lineus longissimus]|uniref:LIM and SH3 domain protein Lasp-like isoform X4 n=1 Tax=Lineus longissimus TaxID=88925 RepID=UPI00315D533A